MITERIAIFFTSFTIAVVVTPLVRSLARRKGVVDAPGEARKLHRQPTPLWGGVALWISLAVVGLVAWQAGLLTDAKIGDRQLGGIFLASLLLVAGGMIDDATGLRPWRQFLFPCLAVVVSIGSGIGLHYLTNPFAAGTGPYGRSLLYLAPWAGSVVAGIWLIGMTYTTKLLDGLDGLVTGIGAIGASILFVVSLYWDVPSSGTSSLALMLAGSLLGFLLYNMHPASIFLGEGGSTLIGYFLGVLAIISGAKIATALLIMGIPILDVVWVIVRRIFVEHASFTRGDRKHLHFRLLDAGLSHRQAVASLWGLTAFFGTVSLFLQSRQKVLALGIIAAVMVLLGSVVVLRYSRKMKEIN